MDPLLVYAVAYLLTPSMTLAAFKHFRLRIHTRGEVILHAGLLVATLIALTNADQPFPIIPEPISIAAFLGVAWLLYGMLGRPGLLYSASSMLQELCVLSVAWVILPHVDLIMLWLLIVPIFALSHLVMVKQWPQRMLATFAWGTISLLLFITTGAWLWSAAFHALGGAFLIRIGWFFAPTTIAQSTDVNA